MAKLSAGGCSASHLAAFKQNGSCSYPVDDEVDAWYMGLKTSLYGQMCATTKLAIKQI